MKLSACRFLIAGLSSIAPLALCGQLSDIRAAINADSVFRNDFELSEGYLTGPVELPDTWTLIGEGQAQIHTDAISGEQALGFTGDWLLFQGPDAGQNVAWLDLLVSPVFIESADLPRELAAGPQAFTEFIRFGEEGEVFVLHGDQQGGGDWLPAGNFDLSPGLPWLRLTLRIDSSTQTWDLWLNEELAAVDLGFTGQGGAAPSFAIRGHQSELTYLDAVYAGPENPLFRDEDNDGLPTAYELARGLDPATSDRHQRIATGGRAPILNYLNRGPVGSPSRPAGRPGPNPVTERARPAPGDRDPARETRLAQLRQVRGELRALHENRRAAIEAAAGPERALAVQAFRDAVRSRVETLREIKRSIHRQKAERERVIQVWQPQPAPEWLSTSPALRDYWNAREAYHFRQSQFLNRRGAMNDTRQAAAIASFQERREPVAENLRAARKALRQERAARAARAAETPPITASDLAEFADAKQAIVDQLRASPDPGEKLNLIQELQRLREALTQ